MSEATTGQKMRDILMADAAPRYVLDTDALERSLGAPLGPLLVEFVRLACRVDPISPWAAFEQCNMHLVFLSPAGSVADPTKRDPWTPDNVLPFLETGFDCAYAGFVDEHRSLPLDARPICLVSTGVAQVVAPNLAGFLSLAAIGGTIAIGNGSDKKWLAFRADRLEDDSFRSASEELCSLPGVSIPEKPSRIVRARADLIVECREPEIEEVKAPGYERIRHLAQKGDRKKAEAELVRWIDLCLGLGDAVHPGRWREIGELVVNLNPQLSDSVRAALTSHGVRVR